MSSLVRIKPGRPHLLFDGDCGICTWSAERMRRMDRTARFVIEPFQRYPEAELAKFGITYARCSKAVQLLTPRGRVWQGAFAVNAFLWGRAPWSLLVALIYAFPPFLLLEIAGYRLIANHRHRLSRWFGMKACMVV